MGSLTGWISPNDRTQEQMDAHEAAVKKMPKFAIAGGGKTTLDKGEKVVLYKFLDDPDVVADMGMVFPWFHQNTGSCVGASLGNVLACLSAVQRCTSDTPTKAMIPFWPYNYAMTRTDEGDRSQGDGAINSVSVERAKKGVLPLSEAQGTPAFQNNGDGLELDEQTEYSWSIANSKVRSYELAASKFPVGTAAVANGTSDLLAGIINGYPGYGGCSMFVSGGQIKGSGANACVVGKFDQSGGHSTGFYGAWNHPDLGMLYLYGNNWTNSTYPADPSLGFRRCTCWVPEASVANIWTRYDGDGEYFNVSHLTYFPANPRVLEWDM